MFATRPVIKNEAEDMEDVLNINGYQVEALAVIRKLSSENKYSSFIVFQVVDKDELC